MKTLEKSIKYTIKKKEHQISRLENSHLEDPIKELNDYLTNQEDDSFLGENFNYLSFWYHFNFIHHFLFYKNLNFSYLSKSTYFAMESNSYNLFIAELVPTYNSAISLTNSIKHLAQMLYLGQKDKAITYGDLLLKMLYGKQYDGGIEFPTHPWFMLELFCRWQSKQLEQIGTRYPDSLGVYQKALDNWNTTNTQLLSDIIDTLTAFHIAQSDEDEQGGENDENGDGYDLEFTSADYFIFPIEILMWLAIRKDLGLPDYTPSDDNKLMQMEINKLPEQTIAWPTDELVEKCKAKLKVDNPGVDFEL